MSRVSYVNGEPSIWDFACNDGLVVDRLTGQVYYLAGREPTKVAGGSGVGEQGPKGDKGESGANGADGDSAYEAAVAGGFVGTEAEWLLSLKGETGDTGPQGEPGADGGGSALDAWPVGSVYIAVDSTSPATRFGGTWSAFAAGRMLIGINGSDGDFDTAEGTGGAKTSSAVVNHTHGVTITDPGHTHVENLNSATTGGLRGATPDTSTNTSTASGYSTASSTTGITATTANPAGGVASFSLMNPFITVYMWKRTA